MVNTRGDRQYDRHVKDRLVYSVYMVTSTLQGSVPFALFAGGGDMLVAVLYSLRAARLVPWCGVGKYYVSEILS